MKIYLVILTALIGVSACTDPLHHEEPVEKVKVSDVVLAAPPKPDNEVMEKRVPAIGEDEAIEAPEANGTKPVESPKIIKTGDIKFETGNIKATRQLLISSLQNLGGYVEEDSQTDNGDYSRKEFVLNIKIPAKNFDTFLGSVSNTAVKIESKNIRIFDVTTQFIDTKTRLNNKKMLEVRYLQLLKKASKISEMLEIESKLEEIRADVESSQGQLNYLSRQVAYSSLSITFYTKQSAQAETSVSFAYQIKEALGNGLDKLCELFFGALSLWPYWIGIFALYTVVKRFRKRKQTAKTA